MRRLLWALGSVLLIAPSAEAWNLTLTPAPVKPGEAVTCSWTVASGTTADVIRLRTITATGGALVAFASTGGKAIGSVTWTPSLSVGQWVQCQYVDQVGKTRWVSDSVRVQLNGLQPAYQVWLRPCPPAQDARVVLGGQNVCFAWSAGADAYATDYVGLFEVGKHADPTVGQLQATPIRGGTTDVRSLLGGYYPIPSNGSWKGKQLELRYLRWDGTSTGKPQLRAISPRVLVQ